MINGDKNTDPEHLGLYRDLKQETYRQGFSFDKLKEKLATIAEAIGLHVQTPRSIHGDYYQILGVSENVGSEAIKKAFRAKARQTHPDIASGGNDRFPDVLDAYKVLSDPSLRRDYDLSQKQKSHRQWSEDPGKHNDETFKKPMLPRYFAHLALILFLLVGTALVADFVTQQLALVDSSQKVVKVKKPLPENQTGQQHVEPADEKHLSSHADKPIIILEEIQSTGTVPETQKIQLSDRNEILNEPLEKKHAQEVQNSYQHIENKNEKQPTVNADNPIKKNVTSDELLKIKVKKVEKQPDVQNSDNLKIIKTNNMDSGLDKLPDPASLVSISYHNKTDKDDSALETTGHQKFPDLMAADETGDTVSEAVVLKETSQINNELEQFISSYCEAYENRDLTKLMTFFEENAIENGTPLHQLLPKYRKNFQSLASIHYRISMVNYIVDPELGRIEVNGLFFLRWRKNQEKQWHDYNGSIRMDLISKDESFINNFFSIRELTYWFMD